MFYYTFKTKLFKVISHSENAGVNYEEKNHRNLNLYNAADNKCANDINYPREYTCGSIPRRGRT